MPAFFFTLNHSTMRVLLCLAATALFASLASALAPEFAAESLVQANGTDIDVPGYSVPSMTDMDGDDLDDLIVGEGASGLQGQVRIYPNSGTVGAPVFSSFSYAQTTSGTLAIPGSGCMGVCPRAVLWNADALQDMVVGRTDGKVMLFTNVGSATQPLFDTGVFLQYGAPGSKSDISVGARATPQVVDWNNDGKKDLLCGSLYGNVRLYLNAGTDTAPDFPAEAYVQQGGGNLTVPSIRSCPWFAQFPGSSLRDFTCGNTDGQVIWYENTGSSTSPVLATGIALQAAGATIDAGTRSRHVVYNWNNDLFPDLLVGAGDGNVHLFLGVPEPAGLGLLLALLAARRSRAVFTNR